MLTGGPTVGQLKTSLSHIEFENEQLKKKTAKLERENRSIENRLVQEQIDNGDLTARLDDARNLLRDRGIESDVKLGSRRRDTGDDNSATDEGPRAARTLPAGRVSRPRRKPPFAQISAPLDLSLPSGDEADSADGLRQDRAAKTGRSRKRADDELDHHSFHTGPIQWLPVANAPGDSPIQIR